MSNALWCHFFLNGGPAERRAYVEALTAGGVNAEPFGGCGGRAPGVVFYEEFSEGVCEFVREVSRDGLDRVLAIALTAAAGGTVWLLLGAGASDVFAWDHWRAPPRARWPTASRAGRR